MPSPRPLGRDRVEAAVKHAPAGGISRGLLVPILDEPLRSGIVTNQMRVTVLANMIGICSLFFLIN